MWNLNKMVNITKQKQTHRKQTSSYQWEEGWGRQKIGVGDSDASYLMYKTNKL